MRSIWWAPTPPSDLPPREWADILTVAATVWGEAENQSLTGKRAVACVVMNRVEDTRWPKTPGEVCLQSLQFSCWNKDSPRLPGMLDPKSHTTEPVWNDCFRAAMEAVFRLEPDPTAGANHYLNPAGMARPPIWARPDLIVARIGDHVFYRL